MDSFIDKLSQRLSGQDAIKANNAAEAQETQRLRGQVENLSNQVAGFDACLQEIRTVNVKSAANVDKAEELLSQGIRKLETLLEQQKQDQKDTAGSAELDAVKAELSELKKLVGELSAQLHSTNELVENQNKAAADQVSKSEDFNHRENLKVYHPEQSEDYSGNREH